MQFANQTTIFTLRVVWVARVLPPLVRLFYQWWTQVTSNDVNHLSSPTTGLSSSPPLNVHFYVRPLFLLLEVCGSPIQQHWPSRARALPLSRLSFVGHTPVESVKQKSFTCFHCGKKLLELTAGKVLLLHFVIGCDLVRVLYCPVFLEIKLTSKLVHRLAHAYKTSLNWLAVVKPYCGHAQEKPHV